MSDNKEVVAINYVLSAKASGVGYNDVEIDLSNYVLSWNFRDIDTSTIVYTWEDSAASGDYSFYFADTTISVDNNWYVLLSIRYETDFLAPPIIPYGFYTLEIDPSGSISYSPDGEPDINAVLPSKISVQVEINDDRTLTVDFNQDVLYTTLHERYDVDGNTNHWFCGDTWRGQTFTVGNTGVNEDHDITSVKLHLLRFGNPGTLMVSIRATDSDGKPTGDDLAVGTIDGSSVVSLSSTNKIGEWTEIALSPYTLSAGTQYAIIARALDGYHNNFLYTRVDSANANFGILPTYTGGSYLYSLDNGASWGIDTTCDNLFKEYGTK